MSDRTHQCRRSCETRVPRHKAFCPTCWAVVPRRAQAAVYRSWRTHGVSGEHASLLLDVEAALEGERPWDSVAR